MELDQHFENLEGIIRKNQDPFVYLRNLPIGTVGALLLDIPSQYPLTRAFLPRMPADQVQISWTGQSGSALLAQSCAFARAVEVAYPKYTGRSLSNAKLLDYGCGWGRLIRLMYHFTAPENIYACDPWQDSIELCRGQKLRAHFALCDYLPKEVPFPGLKFDLIYAFSVFTHLSERTANLVLSALRSTVFDHSLLVVTVRPRKYWELHDQAQNIVDRSAMIKMHDDHGFAFTPHGWTPIDGELLYGDTSISFDYIERQWTEWQLVGHEDLPADPMQTIIFLRPRHF